MPRQSLGDIQRRKPTASELQNSPVYRPFSDHYTDRELSLLYAGSEIEKSATQVIDDGKLGFSTRVLVQANLPHSEPKGVSVWSRQNGNFTLTLQPKIFIDPQSGKEKSYGFPYGTIPRLILYYICGEVLRNKHLVHSKDWTPGSERKICLGHNLTAFMEELGFKQKTGGRRGTITGIKNQMERLFRCSISFDWNMQEGGAAGEANIRGDISDGHVFWWDDKNPRQGTLYPSYVKLSETLYNEILKTPVPLNLDALGYLRGSAFDLDIYSWLSYRLYYLERPTFISWRDFAVQVGADYQGKYGMQNFARNAKRAFKRVEYVWRSLEVEYRRGGFVIKPSELLVPRQNKSHLDHSI